MDRTAKEDTKPSIRGALRITVVANIAGKALGLLSTVVVARLMSPEELGVFAIAMAITAFGNELRSLGAGSYLVRADELTDDLVRRALGLCVLTSWCLGALIALGANAFADYYGDPALEELLLILAVPFVISPYIAVASALYMREFSFGRLIGFDFTAQFLQFIVVVWLILDGWSYYALALGSILAGTIQLGLIWLFPPSDCRWRPRFTGLAEIASFGVFVSLATVVRRMQLAAPDLVIGKLGLARDVALFSRAVGFLEFVQLSILRSFAPVLLPYLADVKRSQESLEDAYARATNLCCVLMTPPILVAGAAADKVVVLFFGGQWVESAAIVSALCFAWTVRCFHVFSLNLFVAAGLERAMLGKELVVLVATVFIIHSAFGWGLVSVAYFLIVGAILDFLLTSYLMCAKLGFSYQRLCRSFLPGIAVGMACWCVISLAKPWIAYLSDSLIVEVAVIGAVASVMWLACIVLIRHPILSEIAKLLGLRR